MPTAHSASTDALRPYVSQLAVAWPAESIPPAVTVLDGTLAFVDISGFTRLTEMLAARGKGGAEELTGYLNATFVELLAVAREAGADLLKWGGDAVLLFYTGAGHAPRAVAAAWQMQRIMRRIGRLSTSVGRCQLRMSVGVHSGEFHFWLVGGSHRELLVSGPAASVTAAMEGTAEAGEILVSPATAALLAPEALGERKGDGVLIAAAPATMPAPRPPVTVTADPAGCLPLALSDHLLAGDVDSEHRQVAVAFVEFSGVDDLLAERGADAVAAALHHAVGCAQRSCAAHHVTFWETDIGVGGGKIMLVAGAPTSRDDDDAGRLLAVVTEIVDNGGALSLRAGVNVGRVFAGDFGPDYRRTFSVKGDAVNLAARLMAKAGPGEIYASVAALARSHIAFASEALAPFAVKGKAAPVRAHRLGRVVAAGAGAGAATPATLAPLIGREAEMAVLDAALAGAEDGRGACVELVGPPGIGKSRLVAEVRAHAAAHRLLETRCDDYRSGTPYAPFRELARQALGVPSAASPAEAGAVLVERVGRDAAQLAPWVPLLATVVDASADPTPESNALEERFRRARLESAFADLLAAVLAEPTLLVVDDTHAMDDASAALLRRLVADAPARPWTILLTRRPEPTGLTFDEGDGVRRLELAPLSAAAVSRLVQVATETSPLPPHREALLRERSGGNPLFLLELVSAAGGAGAADALPDTVEGVLAAQIDRLPPPQRRLLRAASVLGMEVPLDVLGEMVGAEVPAAEFGEFLLPDGPGRLRFRHALLRDTAYEGLPFARRRELHAAAGHVLERRVGDEAAPLLAVHFGQAGEHFPAYCYARMAADRARALYANVEAATFYAQALAAGRAAEEVPAELLLEVAEALGDARVHLGEFAAAEDAYRLARRWAGVPVARSRLGLKMAQVAHRTGSYRSGLQRLTRAERAVEEAADREALRLRAEICSEYAFIRHKQGRNADAVALLRTGVELAERAGEPTVLATTLEFLDFFEFQCGLPGEGEHLRRALEILRREGDQPLLEARGMNFLGMRAELTGRWSDAIDCYRQAKARVELAGDQWAGSIQSENVAGILADQGHLDDAEAAASEALRTFRAAGTQEWIADAELILGRIAARRGDFAQAEERLLSARAVYVAAGRDVRVPHADALLAECRLLAGDAVGALHQAREALAALSRKAELSGGGLDGALVTPLLNRIAGLACAALGDLDSARSFVVTSAEESRAMGANFQLALALQVLAELWPASFPEAADEAAQLFDGMGVVASARRLQTVGEAPVSLVAGTAGGRAPSCVIS